MAAVFPNGVVSFEPPKRNLLDVVDAADINKIQDEIVALETTLGDLPTRVDLLEDEQIQDNQWEDKANTNFKNIDARLAAIESGYNIPAVVAKVGRTTIPSYDPTKFNQDEPGKINLTVSGLNTWNMQGSNGRIRLPRSGFWMFNANARYDMYGKSNGGLFNLAIASVNDPNLWQKTYTREDSFAYPGLNVLLNATYSGWFSAGDYIYLETNQSSDQDQPLIEASLSAFWIKGNV